MDDWGFGFWVVPVAILAALSYLTARHFKSDQTPVAKTAYRFLVASSCFGLGLIGILVIIHLFKA